MNNADQSDDDFGLIAKRDDPSVDVSSKSYEQVGPVRGAGAIKSIANPANRNRLIFIGVAAVVLAGAISYAAVSVDNNEAAGASVGQISKGTRVSTTGSNSPSELQKKAAEEYNEKVLPEVQKEDPSAHPVVLVDENPYKPKSELVAPSKVSDVGKTNNQSSNQASSTAQGGAGRQSQAQAQDIKQIDSVLKQLIEAEGVQQPSLYAVDWDYAPPVATNASRESDVSASKAEAESSAGQKCKPIVRAGQMFMGTTDIALNSDVGGPAALTIRNGALRGYQLIGAFERKEEWLRLELNKLVGPKETVSVTAIGLDVETTLNAVAGDVDRHLMYRYGWWGFGTILKAVGTAAENNANQQVVVTDGTSMQSTQADAGRELKMALGSLGGDIGEVMQDRLNRPITVSLNVGDEVGVFFIEDVCSKLGERS